MKKFIKSSYFLIIMLFIYAPVAIMILFSFNSGNSTSSWNSFSFEWYVKLIKNSPFIKSITVSLFVAMVSTAISLIIGIMAVVGLSKIRKKTADNWVRIANIPLVNADVITAVGLMLIFILASIKFGIVTLIASHVSFNVPYVIITVLPFMNAIDKNILEASKDLGANSRHTFYKVVLPILAPSIITAAAICFAMSFDDFIISYFTGGGQTNVSTFIYTAKRMQPYINAFGTLLVTAIIFLILIWNIVNFSLQKSKEIKLQIKNGEYKLKKIGKLKKEIIYLEKCLENKNKISKTKNLNLLIKFKILKLQIKILNNYNNNKKISQLEWKKEQISSEIKTEKRYFEIFKKLNIKKQQIEEKISKINNDKKLQKYQLLLEKLDKKINKYEKEVEWIKNRNEIDKERSLEIGQQVLELKEELEKIDKNDIKLISWYNKKIKDLSIKRDCLLEGRNQYKLRITIEKLSKIKKENHEKSELKYFQYKQIKPQVYKKTSLTDKLDKKISLLNVNDPNYQEKFKHLNLLKEKKLSFLMSKINKKLENKKNALLKIQNQIAEKKEKYFPNVLEENYVPISKRWIKRNWKQITLGSVFLISFSLLTTAYIMNNIYDLVIGNWGSYIDPELITKFEKKYKYKVNYQQYDSNESLYNKIYTFNYDLMVPSDYMVEKLAREGSIIPIQWDKIENISNPNEDLVDNSKLTYNKDLLKAHKDYSFKDFMGEDSNLLKYSIPWFWGDVRIVFNIASLKDDQFVFNNKLINFLAEKEVIYKNNNENKDNEPYLINNEKLSWSILWEAANEGFDIALNEDPKNVFMYGFEKLYGITNARSNLKVGEKLISKQEQIDNVANEINTLINYKNVGLYGDQLIDKVHDQDFEIAVMYNGDLVYANQENIEEEDDELNLDKENNSFKFRVIADIPRRKMLTNEQNAIRVNGELITNEATNLWSDNLVISSKNNHLGPTYDFINFIYEQSSQKSLIEETGMPTGFNEMIEYGQRKGEEWRKWFKPEKGEPFIFDEKFDNYLVDKFNKIISTKH